MLEVLRKKWKYLSAVLIIFIIMWFVYCLNKDYRINSKQMSVNIPKSFSVNVEGGKSKQQEAKVVYLESTGTSAKEIAYVPKETKVGTGLCEKTDVEFLSRQTKIYVKINGKEYEVPSTVQEDVKFTKGKLILAEQTQTKIEITAPEPRMNIGMGWSKSGLAVQLNGPLYKNISWWIFGNKNTYAGGIQFPIAR